MSREPTPRYDFSLSPLDPDDIRIAAAYEEVGRPLDDLPHTEDFDRLFAMLGRPATDETRHQVYKRLFALRKRGRLAEVAPPTSSLLGSTPMPLDPAERRLLVAYGAVGRPLDDLPYTEDLDRLAARLGRPATDEARHEIFGSLLALRRRGQLPRVDRPITSSRT